MNNTWKVYSDKMLKPVEKASDFRSSATIGIPKVIPKEREEIFAALKYIEALEDNWNEYKSKAPTEGALKASKCFFESFPFNRYYPSKLQPDGDGGLMLLWKSNNSKIIVTVEAGLLHASIENDKDNLYLDPIPYDLGAIPSEILKHIPIRTPQGH